jgi:type IV pilus assembly protein PilB
MEVVVEDQKSHGMGLLLVREKLLTQSEAIEYSHSALNEQISLIQYLVKHQILTAEQIARTAAENFGLPLLNIDCFDPSSIQTQLVNDQLIRRHRIIPLVKKGNYLYIAIDDPSNQAPIKEIQFQTELNVIPIVVETNKLAHLIEQFLSSKSSQGLFTELNDTPVIQLVNDLLFEAIKQGASDIHFEPYEYIYRIRYRQDGILHQVINHPLSLAPRITTRIKVLSNLDISEKRIPQDGSFKLKCSQERTIDFRVSTCPVYHGEKIVIRILDPGAVTFGIEALGFSPMQRDLFVEAIERPQGMILITGPTGSGKTVSLYTALNSLNTNEVNISTAEDPVEIKIAGINQVNINLKAGLTFATALRAFLRQDPDIIMVGEIRDLETAEIAVKAAQTGHLVLSTLHTNSAAETLNRLISLGVPTFNIASSVSLVIAQRLARKLCEQCKLPREYDAAQYQMGGQFKAVGCNQCNQGYKGRIGLFEVLPMSRDLGQLIMSGANSQDILIKARSQGMLTIYESGLSKVKEGITTLEEINRVTID